VHPSRTAFTARSSVLVYGNAEAYPHYLWWGVALVFELPGAAPEQAEACTQE
jgi:hypothetical protein